jgi:hypothetical protein
MLSLQAEFDRVTAQRSSKMFGQVHDKFFKAAKIKCEFAWQAHDWGDDLFESSRFAPSRV